jgi:hypothetical protein
MMRGASTITSRKLIASTLILLAVVQVTYSIKLIGSANARWKSDCESMGREAHDLLSRDPMPQPITADLLELLRSARELCQSGRIDIARQQYSVLQAAYHAEPAAIPAAESAR